MNKEVIGNAVLYQGDCTDILPVLEKVDVVITDPPFGLGKLRTTTSRQRNKNNYASYEDTEENLVNVVIPAFIKALKSSNGRGVVTCGAKNLQKYPPYEALGGFYQPAAIGMTKWGFAGLNPILYYGKDPRAGRGQLSTSTLLTAPPSCKLHPCSKPLPAMLFLVQKASLIDETVLDPFMGSGTTGVACIDLGRKFIGIELEPVYFELACERIYQAHVQKKLLP